MTTIADQPSVATNLAAFGGDATNDAAGISYDVPLPGSYSISRVQPLQLPKSYFTDESRKTGSSLRDLGVISGPTTAPQINSARWLSILDSMTPESSRPGPTGRRHVLPIEAQPDPAGSGVRAARPSSGASRRLYLEDLAARSADTSASPHLAAAVPGLGQSLRTTPVQVRADETETEPTIALVEVYQLSSFLSEYGVGRTLQTYSLLPGERTTVTVETWRSREESRQNSSSIFDSSDVSAEERFTAEVERESGTSTTDSGTWASSLATDSGGGFNFFGLFGASTNFKTYDAATSQYERQAFCQSVGRTASEHSSQVNNSRQQNIQTIAGSKDLAEDSTTTVREIANTNLRRVLNFVFRELNQTYETVISLRDVRLAYYNGNSGSARIVPLSKFHTFITEHVVPDHRPEVAKAVLSAIAECIDDTGTPLTMLQVGEREEGVFKWRDAMLDATGLLDLRDDPSDAKYGWRLKNGPIGQEQAKNKVPGVVSVRSSVVLRTDNIIVEALLGQADALDPYAAALQAIDLRSRQAAVKELETAAKRVETGLELIDKQDAGKKVAAWEAIFGDHPAIQIVPAAAVTNGSKPS